MELKFETEQVQVEHARWGCAVVAEVKEAEILEQFTASDIAAHFDHAELLDAIGEGNAREHFDIGEAE